jgi:hypothetical protein
MRPDWFEHLMALLVAALTACAIFSLIARLLFGWYDSRYGVDHGVRCANSNEGNLSCSDVAAHLDSLKCDSSQTSEDAAAKAEEALGMSTTHVNEPYILEDDASEEDETLAMVLEPPTEQPHGPNDMPMDVPEAARNSPPLDRPAHDVASDDEDLTERTYTF